MHSSLHPHRRLSAAILLTLCALALSVAPLLAQTTPPPSAPSQPPNAAMGRQIYMQNCAPCHGQTGRGDGPSASGLGVPPTAFADATLATSKTLNEWFDVTKNGRMARMMPPWSNRLADQQIWDAVAYAWTLHTTTAEIGMGEVVYQANCQSCHGADGKGKPPIPDLTDFARVAAAKQTDWAQVVAKGRGTMPGFDGKLSAAEQRTALEYVRSLAFGAPPSASVAKGAGVITGTVVNGTTGLAIPNLTVSLAIFDATSLLEERTATTDAAGVYRFAELSTDATLLFAAQTEYPAGVPYFSNSTKFAAGTSSLNLPLSVYETTSDPAGISADRVHYIVEFANGRLLVAELMLFSLTGNRAYIGTGMGTLRFTVPAGAEDLEISDGEIGGQYVPTNDGFVDTLPLPPGQGSRQVLFRYALPYSVSTLDLVRTIPYPTGAINALVTDVGAQVSSAQLANQGVRQTANGSFINLVGQSIPANQPITLRFTNLPAPGASDASGQPTRATGTDRAVLFILAGAAGLVAVLLAAWPLLRRKGAGAKAPAPADREGLLDALALLEAAFEAGELSEAAYRDQRLRIKAQLADLASNS